MGPLDDPPTANKGGVRAPFFGLIPRGSVGGVPCECAEGANCRCFVLAAGQSAALLPVLCWKLVLRVGSFGENVGAALVFELGALFAPVLRQRLTSLACCSGEQGRRSSFWESTFVCN